MSKSVDWYDCIVETIEEEISKNPEIDTSELQNRVKTLVISKLGIKQEDTLIENWASRLCREKIYKK